MIQPKPLPTPSPVALAAATYERARRAAGEREATAVGATLDPDAPGQLPSLDLRRLVQEVARRGLVDAMVKTRIRRAEVDGWVYSLDADGADFTRARVKGRYTSAGLAGYAKAVMPTPDWFKETRA